MAKRQTRFIDVTIRAAVFAALISVGVPSAGAQELAVEQALVSVDIANREPVDPGNSFPASVARLYCFTKISGALDPTDITHVWYFGDIERARITLAVGGSPWRTYSSKSLLPNEVGPWHVDILDVFGNTMKTVRFDVTP
jgi:hypothetical protein